MCTELCDYSYSGFISLSFQHIHKKKETTVLFNFLFFIFNFLSFPPQVVTNSFVLFSHLRSYLMLCFQAVADTRNCSK